MSKNTNKHKAIKKLIDVNPPPKTPLPFGGVLVEERGFSFSFSAFDRAHELFNLSKNRNGEVMDGLIGMLIDSVFYIVWLDPHHNLTDSEGYGGVKIFPPPKDD